MNQTKKYKYKNYHLNSRPVITEKIIDTKISNILELINQNPNLSNEQLETLQNKIRNLTEEKERRYLTSVVPLRNTGRKIHFSRETKPLGGKRRTRKIFTKKKRNTNYKKPITNKGKNKK